MKRALEIKLRMGIMKCLGSYSEEYMDNLFATDNH
jgi:hypothetical protein